jgi:predicted kinase/predicted phosphodiesterase
MRKLLVLTGAPGSGKDYFIKEHNLEEYVLSVDDFRSKLYSTEYTAEGEEIINPRNDGHVWEKLLEVLDLRMQRGLFTIINAVHAKTTDFNRYDKLAKQYKYRLYVYSLRDVSKEACIKRNDPLVRGIKAVSPESIEKTYAYFQASTGAIKKKFTHIENIEDFLKGASFDVSKYKKVLFIGDIHGNLDRLTEAVPNIEEDTYYVFLGDYIDRGNDSLNTVKKLMEYIDNPNVFMLEGNHEYHLWAWATDALDLRISKYFINHTMPEFEAEPSSFKKEVRIFYRKLGQMARLKANGIEWVATHGGISIYPKYAELIPTSQLIKGIGRYGELEIVHKSFSAVAPPNTRQVHGHRNVNRLPHTTDNINYVLENDVDAPGGYLRTLEWIIDTDTVIEHQYKNPGILAPLGIETETQKEIEEDIEINDDMQYFLSLSNDPGIEVKKLDNGLVAVNFTRGVFRQSKWNQRRVKARGLFVDPNTGKVIARSFDKTFHWDQYPNPHSDVFSTIQEYPVRAWNKYNGYLGICSTYNNEIFYASKSTNAGWYANNFKEMMIKTLGQQANYFYNFLHDNSLSAIFEVIHHDDPHIVEYTKDDLILLGYIKNQYNYEVFRWDEFNKLFTTKTLYTILENKKQMDAFLAEYTNENNMLPELEGVMFEDRKGKMAKFKFNWYVLWKSRRAILEKINRGRTLTNERLSKNITADDVRFFDFMKGVQPGQYKNIVEVRNAYLQKNF